MASTAESLVLGAATRLDPVLFEPFCRSLRRAGYNGEIGFVVGLYDKAQLREFGRFVDFIVPVDRRFGGSGRLVPDLLVRLRRTPKIRRLYPAAFIAGSVLGEAVSTRRRRQALEFRVEGLQALRYQLYREVLLERPAADYVMVSDLRDVLFQADPFDPAPARLELFLEEPHMTLGSDPHNRRWLKDLAGRRAAKRLANHVTSCSGTVLGPKEDMLRYLTTMADAVDARRQPLGSHDQGLHNLLLRSGRLPDHELSVNGHGRVLTMGGMTNIKRGPDGRVLNADGTVPNVLHQFDRHPALARELWSRLGSSWSPAVGTQPRCRAGTPPTIS